MKINEVIRKYRKAVNLTQEQVANYLGVTAPAVNKWENGISYPDITLLAPLARVLKTDVDTLLSFNEELTDIEINKLVEDVSELAQKESFEKAYKRGEELIKEYSNCDVLILSIAQVLNVFLRINRVENSEQYETKIFQWYELIATSDKQEIASMAIAALVSKYTEKEEFDKAQQLLDRIPPIGYDKKLMQAMLFEKQAKYEEAYEIYEQMIYMNANEICNVIQILLTLLCKEEKYDTAEKFAAIAKTAAKIFDLGAYIENTPDMFIGISMKDKERSLDAMEKLVRAIDSFEKATRSDLYKHMKMKESYNMDAVKKMIKRGLESDEDLEFLREEPRFKSIIELLN